jgi:hypothetical protein
MSLFLALRCFALFQSKLITRHQFAAFPESLEISFVCPQLYRLAMFCSDVIIQAKNTPWGKQIFNYIFQTKTEDG